MPSMPDRLTEESVSFAAGLTFESLPGAVVHAAKRCLVDGVGVAVAGLETDVAAPLKTYVIEQSGQGQGKDTPVFLAILQFQFSPHKQRFTRRLRQCPGLGRCSIARRPGPPVRFADACHGTASGNNRAGHRRRSLRIAAVLSLAGRP